jgi:hypothetical protein
VSVSIASKKNRLSKILRPPNDEKNSWLSVAAKGMIR